LERAIDEYARKVREKDFGNEGKQHGPDVESIHKLKEIRDSRRKMYEIAKKAGKPVVTPEEKYNAARAKQIAKRMAEIQDRINRGDYAKREKRQMPKLSVENSKAKKALQDKISEFNANEKQYALEHGPRSERLIAAGKKWLDAPRAWTVFGHGLSFLETHAGALFGQPKLWLDMTRSFKRMLHQTISPKFYDEQVALLETHPLFEEAKASKLNVDPHDLSQDNIDTSPIFPKLKAFKEKPSIQAITQVGNRGMFVLKPLRMRLFEKAVNDLPPEIALDPTQRKIALDGIASDINKATGTISRNQSLEAASARNIITRTVLFAPKLFVSKWSRGLIDPLRTIKDLTVDYSSLSAAQKHLAFRRVRNAGWFMGTGLGLLAVNQALLKATGSKQSVNFLDPSSKNNDWLAAKIAGRTLKLDAGVLDPLRLIAKLVSDLSGKSTEKQSDFKKPTRVEAAALTSFKYLRGQMNPTISYVLDAVTGQDYSGRPQPWSKESGTKFRPKITWREFSASHLPIVGNHAMHEFFDGMKASGLHDKEANEVMDYVIKSSAFTGSAFGAKISNDWSLEPKQETAHRPKPIPMMR